METIEIWRIPLDDIQLDQLSGWRDTLCREEQLRADAFHGEEHRREYVIAHIALRTVLASLLRIPPVKVEFAEGAFASSGMHGKAAGRAKPALLRPALLQPVLLQPALLQPAMLAADSDIRFNLSHTRGAALVGVALGRELGVDIERERPMEDLEAIARSVMSFEEWNLWLEMPERDRERAFYRLWARKESYLKAIGLGLFRHLQDVTVPVSAYALPVGQVNLIKDIAGTGAWQVLDIEAGLGFAASVSVEGTGAVRLVVHTLNLPEIRGYAPNQDKSSGGIGG